MNNRIYQLLKKYVGPSVLGGITIDGYRRQVFSHQREIQELNNKNAANLNLANTRAKNAEDKLSNNEILANDRYNHLEVSANNIEKINDDITKVQDQIRGIESKLLNKNYGPGETKESILITKQRYLNENTSLLKDQAAEIKDIKEYITNIKNSNVLDWF